jgi:hypothetical protein
MIQNHHIAYWAFLFLADTLLKMMKQMISTMTPRYYLHQQTPFSNGTMANINDILPMETVIYQNYQQMKVNHTSTHSAQAYLNSWMIK